MSGPVVHWDELEPARRERGHIAGTWWNLGVGSHNVGVKRMQVDPGRWSTPAHVQGAEEEIFYILGGSGLSWQDEAVYEIREGDCIVHLAGREAHTVRAGPDGIDLLAFGMRVAVEAPHLPRAGVSWLFPSWVAAGEEPMPWDREAAAGEPPVGELSPRPPNIVNPDDVEGEFGGLSKPLAAAAGSEQTGLNLVALPPGQSGAPAHCHSAEEELFVVLEGEGMLELVPSPTRAQRGAQEERHPVRAGSIVARPPGTGVAHAFWAGDAGLTFLAYGTREPNDVAYYPRSKEISWRGVGVVARLDQL